MSISPACLLLSAMSVPLSVMSAMSITQPVAERVTSSVCQTSVISLVLPEYKQYSQWQVYSYDQTVEEILFTSWRSRITGVKITGSRITGSRITGVRITGSRITRSRITGSRITSSGSSSSRPVQTDGKRNVSTCPGHSQGW